MSSGRDVNEYVCPPGCGHSSFASENADKGAGEPGIGKHGMFFQSMFLKKTPHVREEIFDVAWNKSSFF